MKDLSKEIMAYALQNAIEYGKADVSKILGKLFQHGLQKNEIKEVMPQINAAVEQVNSMTSEVRTVQFASMKNIVMKREEENKELPELPGMVKKPVFRLAPFPSGALHIGNAKTYLLNALYSEKYNGKILLVMDDTIGSSEKPLVKDSYQLIEDAFKWLGVHYDEKIVYKSDRLDIYYKYAEKLIKLDRAYVCHCAQEILRENRAKGRECGCRLYPRDKQLERWKAMFKAAEGSATLRIKTDMKHPNPAFRDRVLFKISDREHPRVGKKYRVWPSLEMSWSIDDHDLGITHIIRGNDLMIETDMEKYVWDIFKWKHSETIHTGLVNLEGMGAKVSKSKAQKEVLSGEFTGWDDPRTWSVQSLARRGIKAEAIREFVKEVGLNRQDITVPIDSLYAVNRKLIDASANRYSFVANPVGITLDGVLKEVATPLHPDKKETKIARVSGKVFVSKDDFEKLKGKEVRLLHLFNVKLKEKTKIESEEVKDIPKINWVSEPLNVKVLMPDGVNIEGFAEVAIANLPVGETIQFERFGFCRFQGQKDGIYEFWFAHR